MVQREEILGLPHSMFACGGGATVKISLNVIACLCDRYLDLALEQKQRDSRRDLMLLSRHLCTATLGWLSIHSLDALHERSLGSVSLLSNQACPDAT